MGLLCCALFLVFFYIHLSPLLLSFPPAQVLIFFLSFPGFPLNSSIIYVVSHTLSNGSLVELDDYREKASKGKLQRFATSACK